MKFTRSHLLTIVYSLLVVLYTLYLAQLRHPWRYYLEFMLISGYCFFISQGILLRSKNWGILLLLPLAVSVAAVIAGYLLLFILRLGGGTLLDADRPDMILLSLLVILGNAYSLRWIKGVGGRKGARKGKK
ncbi:MAG TPA: hypothetical protein VHC50_01135 [Puia sp.]|jgi:hypothetical protein|nr:hypothetical protein [Puia sp.]